MKKAPLFCLIMLFFCLLNGCVSPQPVPKPTELIALNHHYKNLAEHAEKTGDLQNALKYRRLLYDFIPNNLNKQRVTALEKKINLQADSYYWQAVDLYKIKKSKQARQQLLHCLSIAPMYSAAISLLKEKSTSPLFKTHYIKNATHLAKIARSLYGNSHLSVVLDYFNQLNRGQIVAAHSEITYPTLGRYPSYFQTKKKLIKKTREEKNKIKQLKDKEKKVKQEKIKNQQAENIKNSEKHYRLGVKYFLEEKIKQAIEQWQTALQFNPLLKKAKKDIKNALSLLDRIKKIRKK